MTPMKIGASLGMFVVLFAAVGLAQETKNEMIPVTYDGLKQEVLKQRGKVLILDFWAGT